MKIVEERELTGHLMGGLGNVLFIVATCFALSKQYKVKLRFYSNENVWRDSKRRMIHAYKMFEKFDIDRINNRKSGITIREPYFFYDSITLDRRTHNCIYGYFQSYKSIHVRRTDYLALSDIHLNLNIAYYEEAISHFSREKSIFLIFSDDVTFIQNEPLFLNLPHKHIITNEDDEYCFWLMSACHHNIIANSSYSWWASYINSNPNKLVMCPSKWFGPRGPVYKIRDIIPETKNYKMIVVNSR